jgi:hypothetical protein
MSRLAVNSESPGRALARAFLDRLSDPSERKRVAALLNPIRPTKETPGGGQSDRGLLSFARSSPASKDLS